MSGFYGHAPVVPGGAVGVPPYALVTGWGSLNDADSIADTGSAMSAGTGTIVTKVGTTTQIDGYQEGYAGWDIPLTTLYADWVDATDLLEFCLEIAAMPLTAAKWGWAVFMGDNTYANRATQNGTGLLIFPNSTTVTQACQMGATANASTATNNGTNVNVATQVFGQFRFDSGGVPRTSGLVKRTSDQGEIVIAGSPVTALGAAANRRLNLVVLHESGTGGAVTLSARLYTRRIRRAQGPFV